MVRFHPDEGYHDKGTDWKNGTVGTVPYANKSKTLNKADLFVGDVVKSQTFPCKQFVVLLHLRQNILTALLYYEENSGNS